MHPQKNVFLFYVFWMNNSANLSHNLFEVLLLVESKFNIIFLRYRPDTLNKKIGFSGVSARDHRKLIPDLEVELGQMTHLVKNFQCIFICRIQIQYKFPAAQSGKPDNLEKLKFPDYSPIYTMRFSCDCDLESQSQENR